MCITNDDAIGNGSKCNNVIEKKKMLEEEKRKPKKIKWWRSCNNKGKERNKRWKRITVATKMKKKW